MKLNEITPSFAVHLSSSKNQRSCFKILATRDYLVTAPLRNLPKILVKFPRLILRRLLAEKNMLRLLLLSLLALLPISAQLVPSNLDKRITIPEGLTLNRFADQNQVRNATAICIDAQNRVYIAETNRWRVQVQDIRHGGRFLRDRVNGDISNMTLDDRTDFHKKWSGKQDDFLKWEEFTKDSEVIKLLEDTDGDGVSDKTTIYRGDFNAPLAGPSGGLIEKDGTVYFAMIPGVYSLKDTNNDGKAEEVKTLVNGFGVRVSFSGHDLNGFAWGPDGKLYWSIGDRGYHVEQDGKTFARPDSGGVFRANPDGSEFEEFYINLRNPKEIVFDEFGNLFTVDNDYDQGDRERIVYLVEHGDSGWKNGPPNYGLLRWLSLQSHWWEASTQRGSNRCLDERRALEYPPRPPTCLHQSSDCLQLERPLRFGLQSRHRRTTRKIRSQLLRCKLRRRTRSLPHRTLHPESRRSQF